MPGAPNLPSYVIEHPAPSTHRHLPRELGIKHGPRIHTHARARSGIIAKPLNRICQCHHIIRRNGDATIPACNFTRDLAIRIAMKITDCPAAMAL